MAGINLKLALILILCIQAIIWSRSRQATIEHPNAASSSSPKLWSRDLSNIYDDGFAKDQCYPRQFPVNDQCAHVKSSCHKSETLLQITYLEKYYCSSPRMRPGYFMGLVVWLIFLFSTLGISASDFFCPNLATISAILGLDENVAGVTFLALGNGSPDVFSTFSAMKAQSGSLAIGELIGAASFIVSVVVGSMAIIKPFKVNRGPFLRDVGFFAAAIALLLGVLMDHHIKLWEAGLLVLLYALYVTVVVMTSWFEKRNERRRRKEDLLRGQFGPGDADETLIVTPYRDDPEDPYRDDSTHDTLSVPTSPDSPRHRTHSAPTRPSLSPHTRSRRTSHASQLQNLPSYSLLGALEFRTAVNLLRQQSSTQINALEASPITPYAAGHYHNPILGHTPRDGSQHDGETESYPWENNLSGVALDERHHGDGLHESTSLHPSLPARSRSTSVGRLHEEVAGSPAASSFLSPLPEEPTPKSKRQRTKAIVFKIFHTLFPTLHHFTEKSILGMIAALFAAPAVLGLTLTLPVVVSPQGSEEVIEKDHNSNAPVLGNLIDFEEDGVERALVAEQEVEEELHDLEFNKWLMALQCICAPLFCSTVLFNGSENFSLILLIAGLVGFIIAILVSIFADRGNDPAARVARTSMGFFVAIVWIMAIADEVVQVLQTFGVIFGLSDAIIGLTIFAVGNSLADFVANITVAAFAPIMGFSACFGGPMLNILLGVGLSGTYLIQQTGTEYKLHLSTTLLVSSFGLLLLLLVTMIVVPWNGYMLTRAWGMFLIMFYIVIMTVNVVVELRQDND